MLLEWLVLYWSYSSGVAVKFAQSFSQWEAWADTGRNVLADKKPGNLD
jgi:hypothetical protein